LKSRWGYSDKIEFVKLGELLDKKKPSNQLDDDKNNSNQKDKNISEDNYFIGREIS
jgi:hypothetical protein